MNPAAQIWVDADACPVAIKEVLFRAAEREQVPVTLVANQWLRTPPSRFVRAIQVPAGFDVADNEIVLDKSLLMPLGGDASEDGVCIPVRVGSCLADAERQLIVATLNQLGGNKRRAAEVLGCSVKTLYNKLHHYRLADGREPEAAVLS